MKFLASESIFIFSKIFELMTLLIAVLMSSSLKSFNSNIWHLLLMAGLIAWYGLEVVSPIKVISPDSR